ncbi:HEAT repeat domain-containing protein [Candidatus Ozemobacteraceae bacterium]|nr:HEAT repeat domain-containing protein [Candidatus Ozemobacteraceae bacterium]
MKSDIEQAVIRAVEHATRTGRFSPDARALIRDLFATLQPTDWPGWLLESIAAVPGEIEFIQECLIAQEEGLKRRIARAARPDNATFLRILSRIGSPQTTGEPDMLFQAAEDGDPRIRGLALLRLGECRCDGIGQIILRGLDDPDPYVRKCAVEAIYISIGDRGTSAWERVIASERDADVREAALVCLARSGDRGRDAMRRLGKNLSPREKEYISINISS